MFGLINRYKIWKTVNKYIKYYREHTDRDISYIPIHKIKVQNKKHTYCLNEFNNDIYKQLIFIAFNDTNDEELEDNIKHEVSHYICNEVYRLHCTEIYNNDLPQFIEIRSVLK